MDIIWALLIVGSLYAPVELTRVIILYAGQYPNVVPPIPFAVEVAVIWFPWVVGACIGIARGFRRLLDLPMMWRGP